MKATAKKYSRTHKCKSSPSKAHYWKVESPNGRYSKGVCSHCSKVREFENSHNYSNWYKQSKDKGQFKRKITSKSEKPKLSSALWNTFYKGV